VTTVGASRTAVTRPAPRPEIKPRQRGDASSTRRLDLPLMIVEPRPPGMASRFAEAWRYRGLIGFFGRRLVRKFYQRTFLGRIWIPLRPALQVVPQILIFGGVLGVPSDGVPYALFFMIGQAIWEAFGRLLYYGTRSVELNRQLIKRLYFPRSILPIAATYPAAVELVTYGLMAAITVAYFAIVHHHMYLKFTPELLLVPAGLALMAMLALGIAYWLSVFCAQFRDVRFAIHIGLGFWYLITPVIYPLSAIPAKFRPLAYINPLTAPVEMIKHGLLGVGEIPITALAITIASVVVIGTSGLWFFHQAADFSVDRL
jgi:lipopolysaccharide transport system permease protein